MAICRLVQSHASSCTPTFQWARAAPPCFGKWRPRDEGVQRPRRRIGRGQDNNILTQVGIIVLIGLAAKNAILIVEFARQLEDSGRDRWAAAVEAARLRLRPILMTSLAFIFGVVPLVWATGAGAELRQALGTAVFSGMIGVTAFGLIFTPAFYVICRWLAALGPKATTDAVAMSEPAE
jgi:predicted RND superfamily exporter protein